MLARMGIFRVKWTILCAAPIGNEPLNVILRGLVNKDAGKESFKSGLWINYHTFFLGRDSSGTYPLSNQPN